MHVKPGQSLLGFNLHPDILVTEAARFYFESLYLDIYYELVSSVLASCTFIN